MTMKKSSEEEMVKHQGKTGKAGARKSGRTSRKASRKMWWIVLVAVLLAGAGVAAFILGRYYIDNRKPNFTSDYILYVYPETTLQEISDSLAAGAGMVRERSLWRAFDKTGLLPETVPGGDSAVAASVSSDTVSVDVTSNVSVDVTSNVSGDVTSDVAALSGTKRRVKPGKYVVTPQSTSMEIARKLLFGWQTADNRLVLSGTLRMKDRLAQKISKQMMVDSLTVINALNDSAFLSRYGRTPEDIFGFFLKDSYEMYWTLSIEDIFNRFAKEYNRFWNEERRAKARAQGLTPKEVEIIASIVTGESLVKAEFPMIAGVYLNRFHKGMRLQADPTIAFCYDYTLDRILKKHLSVDSPYNTYKHVGLPPAPINVPEKAALEAVLNPAHHNYLYFCASPDFDGTHDFAASYSEHLRNARKFQRALTARRRAQAAAGQ